MPDVARFSMGSADSMGGQAGQAGTAGPAEQAGQERHADASGGKLVVEIFARYQQPEHGYSAHLFDSNMHGKCMSAVAGAANSPCGMHWMGSKWCVAVPRPPTSAYVALPPCLWCLAEPIDLVMLLEHMDHLKGTEALAEVKRYDHGNSRTNATGA